jgi:hypothetical protein
MKYTTKKKMKNGMQGIFPSTRFLRSKTSAVRQKKTVCAARKKKGKLSVLL